MTAHLDLTAPLFDLLCLKFGKKGNDGVVDLLHLLGLLLSSRLFQFSTKLAIVLALVRGLLLQAMNITAADKYSEMAGYAAGLVAFADQLNGKYEELVPQLAQIDAMEAQVGELENAVAQLDSYSRRLEAKFQSLDVP